jgi:anti-sigma-K factor RskA
MSDERGPADLAAEYALGVLSGAELADARRRVAADAEFALSVARWRGRLAPLGDGVDAAEPPHALWPRIEAATAGPARGSGDNVVVLRRRLNLWRGAAAGMTALAATLAAVLVIEPRSAPVSVEQPGRPPMVAMLSDEQKQMRVVASWNPEARQLVLAVAGDMPRDPAHAHEVWIIPAGGKPRSLGTMGRPKVHMRLADALASLMENGATIAISAEPPGGSRTGSPTGPMLVSGELTRA